jgi:hypothetical protein
LLLLPFSCKKDNDFIVTQQKFEFARDIKTDPATGDTLYMICIPTGFTPNGDGVDDLYCINGVSIISEGFSMKIFSRTPDLIRFCPCKVTATKKGRIAKKRLCNRARKLSC